MNDIKVKIESLINNMLERVTLINNKKNPNIRLQLLNQGLELIKEANNEELSNEDKILLKKVTVELIKYGQDKPIDDDRKHKKIYEKTNELKEELNSILCIETKEPIETFNDWIKSLKIYKLNGSIITKDYYKSSYDIYNDIKKVVLTRTATMHQQIHALRVSEKLTDENNLKNLPEGLTIRSGDYELSEILRLIKLAESNRYEKYGSILGEKFYEVQERDEFRHNLQLLLKK